MTASAAYPHLFIDTHCHLDFSPFREQIADTLARSANAGVVAMIVPAVSADRFANLGKLAADYAPIYAAFGLHPIYTAQHEDADLAELEALLATRRAKIVAVGEIGLDFSGPDSTDSQRQRQLWLLRQQLQLAKRYDLPVILHSRQTHDLLASELKRAALPRTGVVHGFSGSLEQAQRFVCLGYSIGIGGVITYPRARKTRAVVAALPLDSLLLETDSPDMPLEGYQGQPNRPERIAQVFAALCALRPHQTPESIAATIYRNTSQQLLYGEG